MRIPVEEARVSWSRSSLSVLALVAGSPLLGAPLRAQTSTPPTLAPYRAPVLALVQPAAAAGGTAVTVPQDRPVVVFRFAAGEPDDPLDARSFAVVVDGVERTALFQATATQAWGPLADEATVAQGQLAPGAHRVVARICSSRGACTTTEAQLLVIPGLTAPDSPPDVATASRTKRVLGAVLGAARKLLVP